MCQKDGILVDQDLHQDLAATGGESRQTLPNESACKFYWVQAAQSPVKQRPPATEMAPTSHQVVRQSQDDVKLCLSQHEDIRDAI